MAPKIVSEMPCGVLCGMFANTNTNTLLQSRSQTLQKQLQEMHEQIEQTVVEMKTFENLRQHEVIAVPKRVEVCASLLLHYTLCCKA